MTFDFSYCIHSVLYLLNVKKSLFVIMMKRAASIDRDEFFGTYFGHTGERMRDRFRNDDEPPPPPT